jgi:cytochrome P450
MFETLISAVQSDGAGDALLYFCAFVLFSIFIVRYSTIANLRVPQFFNPFSSLRRLVLPRNPLLNGQANKLIAALPSPPSLPLIGHLALVKPWHGPSFLKNMCVLSEKYSEFFVLKLGREPFIVCSSPSAVKDVFSGSEARGFRQQNTKGTLYKFLHPWLGTGLLTSNGDQTGDKWITRRKMLTPAFHFSIIKQFVTVFNEQSRILVHVLDSHCNATKDGSKVVDVFPIMTHATLDVICAAAMGRHFNAQLETNNEYASSVKMASELIWTRMTTPFLNPDFIWKISPQGRKLNALLKVLHGFTDRVIAERRASRQNSSSTAAESNSGDGQGLAFLDLLLENESLSDSDIREEVDTFMFEGHDTTASGLSFTMWCLGRNPSVMEKLQREVYSVCGRHDPPTWEQAKDLVYCDMVLKEGLRLFPPVPSIGRTLNQNVSLLDHSSKEMAIPKHSDVIILPYVMHRSVRHWGPDAGTFRPERFDRNDPAQDTRTTTHPYLYLPFSQGQRNCIGRVFADTEQKVVLAHLVQNFDWISVQEEKELDLQPELIMKPGNGIHLRMFRRVYPPGS